MCRDRFYRAVVLAVPLLWLSGARAACDQENVKVTVVAVLASDKNKEVDPRLKSLADKVKEKHPGLTCFQVAQTTRKSLEVGKQHKFPLVDNETVAVTIEHGADKNNRVELTVKTQFGQICYTGCCGKYLPIWTDYKTANQESLIVAIMVEPCKK